MGGPWVLVCPLEGARSANLKSFSNILVLVFLLDFGVIRLIVVFQGYY